MPKALENQLKKEALKHHLRGKRFNAYVYGTLNKIEKKKDVQIIDLEDHPLLRYKLKKLLGGK